MSEDIVSAVERAAQLTFAKMLMVDITRDTVASDSTINEKKWDIAF